MSPERSAEGRVAVPRLKRFASRGFTVIEMVVVLAVAGVLASIAAPAVFNMVRDNSVTSASNMFLASLNFARNQALLQHTTVLVCQTSTPTIALPQCVTANGTTGYASGWIVFTDTTTHQPIQSTDILKTVALDSNNTVKINGSGTSTTRNVSLSISFTPLGMLPTATGTGADPYFVICDDRAWARSGQYARVISISGVGRISSAYGNQQATINLSNTVTSCTPS